LVLGNSQNLARALMEAPANFLTPTQFCLEAEKEHLSADLAALRRELADSRLDAAATAEARQEAE